MAKVKKALIFRGGWNGHDPIHVSERLAQLLEKNHIQTEIFDGLDCLADREKLTTYDLIVPCFTMGKIPSEYVSNISWAVAHGTGLAGCHGGMCDAFRESTEWQFMTGGQWVAHPGNTVEYTVNICRGANPITEGIADFRVNSEQYYLHVDPAIEILATTRFPVANGYHAANKPIDMPVVWTKYWGLGRVFYNSLGHTADVFRDLPSAEMMMERGMVWAADGKAYAAAHGLDASVYEG